MTKYERLRCLELATSIGAAPDEVMNYAKMFAQFCIGSATLSRMDGAVPKTSNQENMGSRSI